jgi:histone-lysine N-methyltransferase SETD2
VTKEGVPTVSQRDLGLLLEAVALTTNPKTQADLVEYGLLQAFQVCVHKLGGADAGPDYVPILRKIIKIIDNIMTNSPKLVKDGVVKARTARGTLAQALADLRRSPDGALRNLSGGFCAKLDQDAVASTGGYGRPAGGPGGLGFSGPGATPGRASPRVRRAGKRGRSPSTVRERTGVLRRVPRGDPPRRAGSPRRADRPSRPPRPRPRPGTSAREIGTAPRDAASCSRPSPRVSGAARPSPRMRSTPRRRRTGPVAGATGFWAGRSPAAGRSVPEAAPSGTIDRRRRSGRAVSPRVTSAARLGT